MLTQHSGGALRWGCMAGLVNAGICRRFWWPFDEWTGAENTFAGCQHICSARTTL